MKKLMLILALALSACAPMPDNEVTLAECEQGNSRCTLCVDKATGEGDWYVDISSCPDGKYRISLKK